MQNGRTRKEQRIDQEHHYGGMAERAPAEWAKRSFERKPYQAIDVVGYMKKHGIRRDADGQA